MTDNLPESHVWPAAPNGNTSEKRIAALELHSTETDAKIDKLIDVIVRHEKYISALHEYIAALQALVYRP